MEWSPLISGAIGGLVATFLVGRALRRVRGVSVGADGWRRLRPSGMIWAAILGAAAFSLLTFYVYFFIGSDRPDAEEQMAWCLGIAMSFAALAAATAWFTFVPRIEWKGETMRITRPFGNVRTASFKEIVGIRFIESWHVLRLEFANGRTVDVSPLMHGSRDLMIAIEDVPETP